MESQTGRRQIRKVAVLGSGVMGSGIAAHFANAGIPSLVLDIVPREPNAQEQAAGLGLDDRRVRNRIAAGQCPTLLEKRLITRTPARISPRPAIAAPSRACFAQKNATSAISTIPRPDQIA